MSEAVTHQMMMLRPLQAGLSGYARLQGEAGRQLVQVNLRGMQPGEMRVFWYTGEGFVRELGRTSTNQRGEASLSAEVPADAAAPRRLTALLITDGQERPKPLSIGLCTAQSAGSLLDAKNALLALCEKLSREASKPSTSTAPPDAPPKEPSTPEPKQERSAATAKAPCIQQTEPLTKLKDAPSCAAPSKLPPLPREVFLPAIEARRPPERRRMKRRKNADRPTDLPTPPAATPSIPTTPPSGSAEPPRSNPQPPLREPADALSTLQWPAAFQPLAGYFAKYPPQRLMDQLGWRFVQVPQEKGAIWIGYYQKDDRVSQVAYALPAEAAPPQGLPFRPITAADGQTVQLLVLQA